ncbi:hypothetical protein RND71_038634 [Anisodus tanguticus]|uniref:Uncharacterized protein n=1 Tax=Anisodus tanguticus TaxID=243964 RepID=A0AAE1USA4_9SOLA|nr:hypothetical protein RND71_038634 [Anisodus tanguticus]
MRRLLPLFHGGVNSNSIRGRWERKEGGLWVGGGGGGGGETPKMHSFGRNIDDILTYSYVGLTNNRHVVRKQRSQLISLRVNDKDSYSLNGVRRRAINGTVWKGAVRDSNSSFLGSVLSSILKGNVQEQLKG